VLTGTPRSVNSVCLMTSATLENPRGSSTTVLQRIWQNEDGVYSSLVRISMSTRPRPLRRSCKIAGHENTDSHGYETAILTSSSFSQCTIAILCVIRVRIISSQLPRPHQHGVLWNDVDQRCERDDCRCVLICKGEVAVECAESNLSQSSGARDRVRVEFRLLEYLA
jgi:hypothetical protein